MTHDQNQPHPFDEHAPCDHEHVAFFDALLEEHPVNLAALVRACADGELTKAQCDRLAAYLEQHPQARAQVEFERALRSCCKRALSKPCCPKDLRAKIAAQVAHGEGSESDPEPRPAPLHLDTRERSFWARSPVLAIAAVLLLSFAGVLIWQSAAFTSSITPVAGLNMEQAAYYERVSDFVVREHNRCCADRAAKAKLVRRDISQAVEYFSEQFGHRVTMPDLANAGEEIEFFGGGECHVPSTPRSGHFRFDAVDSDGNIVALSLFISPDPGLLPLEEGTTYLIKAKACSDAGARLFAWVSDGVQYLMVSEAPDDMCASVRRAMNAPTSLSSI